jgi:hypothetical protein
MPALKNQHFVPKCLLRPFTIAGNDRAINLYNIRHKRPIPKAPIKGQCARDYLYGKDGKIEQMLSGVEGRYSVIMRRIIDGEKESESDLENLRFVTYLQFRRTEMAVQRSRIMYEKMHTGVFGDDAEDESMPSDHQLMIQSLKMCIEASGECELVARDDETGLARLVLLARTELDEVLIAFQHTLDFLGVGYVVNLALARLRNMERIGQPFLKCLGVNRRAAILERLRHKHLRRIRLAMIRLPQIAHMTVLDAETRNLGSLFLRGHAIPLRIDIDTHTMIDDDG